MDQTSCQRSLRFLIKDQPDPYNFVSSICNNPDLCLDRKDGGILHIVL